MGGQETRFECDVQLVSDPVTLLCNDAPVVGGSLRIRAESTDLVMPSVFVDPDPSGMVRLELAPGRYVCTLYLEGLGQGACEPITLDWPLPDSVNKVLAFAQ